MRFSVPIGGGVRANFGTGGGRGGPGAGSILLGAIFWIGVACLAFGADKVVKIAGFAFWACVIAFVIWAVGGAQSVPMESESPKDVGAEKETWSG